MKLSILHKGLMIVSVPLLFEALFVAVLVSQIDQTAIHINREMRSHDIIIAVETVLKEIAASTTTAIIYNVSRRPDLLARLEESHEEIRSSSARLMRLTRDDDMERSEAARLNASARDWIKNQEKVVNSDPKNRLGAFFATSGNVGNLLLVHSEGSSKTIIERERQIQTVEPQLFRDSIFRIQILLLFGAVVNITITFFLARYFARYISQRLDNVLTNTFKLGARMELNPPMRGDDEIAELDQALHQTASEIMEFETFKEQLIGVVSHEMRTPLTSIQGTLTLLQAGAMGDYPQTLHRSVDETQTQLTRLIHLVNDLLLVERLESGSQVIKQENINLPDLIRQSYERVLNEWSPACPALNMEANTEKNSVELTTVGDSMLLEKAFTILLLASQARMSAQRESLVLVEPGKDGINIIIEDQGPPIDEHERLQYFSKTSQQMTSLNCPHLDVLSGALAKAIITAHGGKLDLSSESTSTAFTIWLPYRRNAND